MELRHLVKQNTKLIIFQRYHSTRVSTASFAWRYGNVLPQTKHLQTTDQADGWMDGMCCYPFEYILQFMMKQRVCALTVMCVFWRLFGCVKCWNNTKTLFDLFVVLVFEGTTWIWMWYPQCVFVVSCSKKKTLYRLILCYWFFSTFKSNGMNMNIENQMKWIVTTEYHDEFQG